MASVHIGQLNDFLAKFLFKLGLRRYPPLETLLSLAAGPDPVVRRAALKYFLGNIASKYPEYDITTFATLPYVPAQKPDGTSFMGTPHQVCIVISLNCALVT